MAKQATRPGDAGRTPGRGEGAPSLKETLIQQAASAGIREAVLVDDRLEPGVDAVRWNLFLAKLRTDHAAQLSGVQQFLEEHDHLGLEDPPEVETFQQLMAEQGPRLPGECPALLASAISKYAERDLVQLETFLVGLGFSVSTHKDTDSVPLDAPLYFIDFSLEETPETAGQKATALLHRIVEKAEETGKPPAVVLMSRNIPPGSAQWQQVADHSGFLRFNFRYHEKPELTGSEDQFHFLLLDLLLSAPLGVTYFAHVHRMREAVKRVADQVTERILRLTPADFGMFAQQSLDDPTGFKATNHLFYLFTNLLRVTMMSDVAVQQSLAAFRDTLMTHPPRVSGEEDSPTLHKIHADLLYDRAHWVLASPLAFGDILWSPNHSGRTFYLVLTPECDLEPRDLGLPKATNIVTVIGTLETQPAELDNLVVTPLAQDEGGRFRWLHWHLRRPVVLQYDDIRSADARYMKWGRLQLEHAEKIQQRFATDLLAVGTEDLVQNSVRHSMDVYGGRNQDELLGTMTLLELQLGKRVFFAFGPDCLFLFPSGRRPVMPAPSAFALQRYTEEAPFRQQCSQSRLYLKSVGGNYYLVNCYGGDPGPQWGPRAGGAGPSTSAS